MNPKFISEVLKSVKQRHPQGRCFHGLKIAAVMHKLLNTLGNCLEPGKLLLNGCHIAPLLSMSQWTGNRLGRLRKDV